MKSGTCVCGREVEGRRKEKTKKHKMMIELMIEWMNQQNEKQLQLFLLQFIQFLIPYIHVDSSTSITINRKEMEEKIVLYFSYGLYSWLEFLGCFYSTISKDLLFPCQHYTSYSNVIQCYLLRYMNIYAEMKDPQKLVSQYLSFI